MSNIKTLLRQLEIEDKKLERRAEECFRLSKIRAPSLAQVRLTERR
jgi:hypothetical protein